MSTEIKKSHRQIFLNIGLYISFFPQLIAGPIIRYKTIAKEINERKETWKDFSLGINRFIIGLGKKVLLANQFGVVADAVFNGVGLDGNTNTVLALWLGAISYTLQIFFDFAGYSDMAIGLGRMFGFHFDETLIILIYLKVSVSFGEDGTFLYKHGLEIMYTFL